MRTDSKQKDMMVGVLEVPDRGISTTERLSDRKLTWLEDHWGPIGKLPQR